VSIRVHEVRHQERGEFAERIALLERGVSYPLGEDSFRLDHGADYFAFFDRLGELSYLVALDGERVVAVAAAVLRRVPDESGTGEKRVWYLCDLKVHSDYRRRRIPWRIFSHALLRQYPRCGRVYGISMNAPDSHENPVASLASRLKLVPVSVATTLNIYSLSASDMERTVPVLESARGPLSFLSLRGKKDLIMRSSNLPMPLLHVQFGHCAEHDISNPVEGHVHMFCAPKVDRLVSLLEELGLTPAASATVIQHRMGDWDWRFVLTSDI
jgi:GNAT superfamily N-acetyltransferase